MLVGLGSDIGFAVWFFAHKIATGLMVAFGIYMGYRLIAYGIQKMVAAGRLIRLGYLYGRNLPRGAVVHSADIRRLCGQEPSPPADDPVDVDLESEAMFLENAPPASAPKTVQAPVAYEFYVRAGDGSTCLTPEETTMFHHLGPDEQRIIIDRMYAAFRQGLRDRQERLS